MSIKIQAKVVGARDLQRALKELPKSMQKSVIVSALKKSAKPVVEQARASVSKYSEKGAQSIKARKNSTLSPVGVSVGTSSEFWMLNFIEFGVSPHTIRPDKSDGVLRFFSESGDPIFTKEIKHPGVKKDPFLRPAWDTNRARVLASFGDEIWKVLQKKARTLRRKAESGTLGKGTIKQLARG